MISRHWWLSSKRMTLYVGTNSSDIVVKTAPIGRKFIGQHIRNIANWLKRQGGFQYKELTS